MPKNCTLSHGIWLFLGANLLLAAVCTGTSGVPNNVIFNAYAATSSNPSNRIALALTGSSTQTGATYQYQYTNPLLGAIRLVFCDGETFPFSDGSGNITSWQNLTQSEDTCLQNGRIPTVASAYVNVNGTAVSVSGTVTQIAPYTFDLGLQVPIAFMTIAGQATGVTLTSSTLSVNVGMDSSKNTTSTCTVTFTPTQSGSALMVSTTAVYNGPQDASNDVSACQQQLPQGEMTLTVYSGPDDSATPISTITGSSIPLSTFSGGSTTYTIDIELDANTSIGELDARANFPVTGRTVVITSRVSGLASGPTVAAAHDNCTQDLNNSDELALVKSSCVNGVPPGVFACPALTFIDKNVGATTVSKCYADCTCTKTLP